MTSRYQGFFLFPAPALDLSFATAGFGEDAEFLLVDQGDRRVEFSCSAGLARLVVSPSLLQVGRGTGVKGARS